MRCLAISLLTIVMISSGCVSVHYIPSTSATYAPTTSVEVLFEKPTRPYVVLGLLRSAFPAVNETDEIGLIRRRAMEIGAHALIEIRFRERTSVSSHRRFTPGGGFVAMGMGGDTVVSSDTAIYAEALAISYTDEKGEQQP